MTAEEFVKKNNEEIIPLIKEIDKKYREESLAEDSYDVFYYKKRDTTYIVDHEHQDELFQLIRHYDVKSTYRLMDTIKLGDNESNRNAAQYIPQGQGLVFGKASISPAIVNIHTGEIEIHSSGQTMFSDIVSINTFIKCAKDGASFLDAVIMYLPVYYEAVESLRKRMGVGRPFNDQERRMLMSALPDVLRLAGGKHYNLFWDNYICGQNLVRAIKFQ